MKKLLIMIFSLVGLSLMMVNNSYANMALEEFTYKEIAVEVAKNSGEGINGELANYTLKKGRVEGSVDKFTATSYDETNETLTLGTSSDNIYADDWRVFTQNNEGLIYEITAKERVAVSFVKNHTDIGWIDDTTLRIYKKDLSGQPTLVVKRDLKNSGAISELEYTIDLEEGETVYYEFLFEWTPYRNMQQPPMVKVSKKGVVLPVDVSLDGTISAKDLHLNTAIFEGGKTTSYSYANFSVKTGEVTSGLVNFTDWEIDYDDKSAQLGLTTDDAYSDKENVYTKNNKGLIYVIEAKDNVDVEISNPSVGGNLGGAKVQIFVDETMVKEYILENEESLLDKIQVDKDKVLYYQIIANDTEQAQVNLNFVFNVKKYTGDIGDPYDFTDLQEITTVEAVDQLVRLNGDDIKLKDIEMNIKQGRLTGKIDKFKYYTFVSEPERYELTSKEYMFDGLDGAAIQTWRMKTTLDSHIVFVFKANKDLKLTFSHDAITAGWIDNNGEFVGMYLASRSNLFTIKEKSVVTATQAADALGGDIHMKSGDVAYWVFGSNISNEANLQIIPKITTNPAAFDQAAYDEATTLVEEKVYMWDAVTNVINNDYLDEEYVLFNLGFYQGDVYETMKLFDYHSGDGSGSADDSLWDSASQTTGFRRWQIEATPGNNAIMKFTAKENVNLTIKHEAVWEDAWSTHTGVRYIVTNDQGLITTIKEILVQANTKDDHFGMEINVRKGEVVYIEYYAKGQFGSLNFAPNFTANIENFDESKAIDFQYLQEVSDLKTTKENELQAYIGTLKSEDYKVSSWSQIGEYYDELVIKFRQAKTKEEVVELYENALANVKAVLTIEQQEAELKAYKETKYQELLTYVNNELNKKKYSKENWELIMSKLELFQETVKSVTLKSQVDVEFTKLKTEISKIETKNGMSTGAWIAIMAGALALIGGTIGVVYSIKKRK